MGEPIEGAAATVRRVILVGNDDAFGRVLEAELEALHFQVELTNADQANERVARNSPDLVVVDLALPENGALRLIKGWKGLPSQPLIVLASDRASLPKVIEAFSEGAHTFLPKPFTAAALVDVLAVRDRAVEHTHALSAAGLKAEGVDRFFAVSPGLLSISGFDGYFKMLNPAWEKTLGFTIDELCSRPQLEFVHPDDRQKPSHEGLESRSGQTVFHYRNRYRCKDGSYRWLSWSVTPSPSAGLIYGSTKDITKVVLMEQNLVASNTALNAAIETHDAELREAAERQESLVDLGEFKDEVTAMLVHDLKNPLSVILTNYDFVMEGCEGSDECLEALKDAQVAGRRMLRLLTNLADVRKAEKGSLSAKLAPVGLSKVLGPLADQRRTLCRSRDITLDLVQGHSEVVVSADPDLLTRTLENILDNALRHTPPGGRITLASQAVEGWAEIRISNSGAPIPPALREVIFEKFRQSGQGQGRMNLGLGLYFSRLACKAQGGTLVVEQTAEWATTFCLRLPTANLEPSAASGREA